MDDEPNTVDVYDRAGFGHSLARGARPAVVVVDFSYGFTDPAYPTGADMTGPVLATGRLLAAARSADVPVVFTTIAYDPGQVGGLTWLRKAKGMAALTAGSRLVEIDDRLEARPDEHIVVKTGASAFFGTGLATYLVSKGVDTVVVAGATTSGCVRATVVDAVQYGFPSLVPQECVADRAPGPHAASLFDIDEKYGDVVDLEEVIDYLARPVGAAETLLGPETARPPATEPKSEVPA
ncbi:isochorismatase family protein [Pseudonocardia nantongensis]|uniref:isochorismatase family protein n=1 Tax=Pseudonocardia nantongensis TaxID=1181885 RepID=UPI00397811D4